MSNPYVNNPKVVTFRGPRGWRVGVRVEGVSDEEIATIITESAWFKPVTR